MRRVHTHIRNACTTPSLELKFVYTHTIRPKLLLLQQDFSCVFLSLGC